MVLDKSAWTLCVWFSIGVVRSRMHATGVQLAKKNRLLHSVETLYFARVRNADLALYLRGGAQG